MTKQYTITLTDAEDKALAVVAYDQQQWIEHTVRERCRVSMDEIISSEIERKLAIGEAITGTKDDIVLAANVETAAERHERILKEDQDLKRLQEEQQG